jgi:hypothetical protein
MTQFPLHDNLRDARRARSEGYAGTLNDRRLTWFQPSRLLTVPAAIIGGLATLTALAALAAPMVTTDQGLSDGDRTQLITQALGHQYSLVWLVAGAVALAALCAVFGGASRGGPAESRRGRLLPIIAAAVLGGLAAALAVYLLTHSLDLAVQAHDHSGGARILLPKGSLTRSNFRQWPFQDNPGLGAWICLTAGILCLASTVLVALNAAVTTPHRTWYRAKVSEFGDSPAR